MLHISFFIHANLQYAEFPESETPRIVEQSYLPALELFARREEFRAAFEFSGVTLELLADGWPEAITTLRALAGRGQIEIMGSTYANPILPLIPTDHARRQIAVFCQIYDQLFGDVTSPQGVYLQEFAYDATLAPLLRQAGYRYTILTPELLLNSLRGNFNLALRPHGPKLPELRSMARYEMLHPLLAQGAEGAEIAVVPLQRDLIDLIFSYSSGEVSFEEIARLLAALHGAHCQDRPGLLLFGPSDAEFLGYYPHQGRPAIRIKALEELVDRLAELPIVRIGLPGEYLDSYPPQRQVYVSAGSSESGLEIWTREPDNQRLNTLCAEASQKLWLAEMAGCASPQTKETLAAAWKAMLLAENSDGRGWMPCPERRLFCYNKALDAIRLAEEVLGRDQSLQAL
jgi:predicted glycosyl hydrolase (DUF1957 family)